MDFMNLNQAAHGDREHGFIWSRMRMNRKVVVGFWQEKSVRKNSASGAVRQQRGTTGRREVRPVRRQHARSGCDRGRQVAAQFKFGYAVNGYGVGDLVKSVNSVSPKAIDKLVQDTPTPTDGRRFAQRWRPARFRARSRPHRTRPARVLKAGDFKGFTTTFEDLRGLTQLPGISPSGSWRWLRLRRGGDWKTAALLRAMKVMAIGLPAAPHSWRINISSRSKDKGLGAHMLEICPSIADGKPSLQVHP